MTLQIPLTRAAGNEDVHLYLMEILEDLQMAKNLLPRKRDGQQPSGHPTGPWRHPQQGCCPACSPAPYILQDLDGDSVHEADRAEVQDDGVEVGLRQP